MSIKDKLSRLHRSRRRAERRSEDQSANRGTFNADQAREFAEPPGETGESPAARSGTGLREVRHRLDPDERHGRIELERYGRLDPSSVPSIAAAVGDRFEPSRTLFVDTETTGLSEDDYAFCIGTGRWARGGFRVRHLVLTDPEQEPEALRRTAEVARDFDVVCTYNGRNFDFPLLERRARELGVDVPFEPSDGSLAHLDLLDVARAELPELDSHRLSDLEEHLIGLSRPDDIPGAEVPGYWAEYLDGAPFEVLEPVLHHNRLDIVSLCAAIVAFTHHANRENRTDRADRPEPDAASGDANEPTRREGGGVAEQLSRSYRLRNRSQTETTPDVSRETTASAGSPNEDRRRGDREGLEAPRGRPPHRHVEALRAAAEQKLAAESWEQARTLLHEIVAFHPRHPFALEHLVECYERAERPELADHFRSRLREVTPY